MIEEVRTVKISSKRQITIPADLTQFKEGDKALLIGTGDEIIIRPVPPHPNEAALLSEKALAKAWLSPEDEAAFAYLQ